MATRAAPQTKAKSSAREREHKLAQVLTEARENRIEIQQRAEAHRNRIQGLRVRYAERQIQAPEDFDETGIARPGSPAEKIVTEVEQLLAKDNFDALLAGADGRVAKAEEELRRHRAESTYELLVEAEPAARAAVGRWNAWAAEGREIYGELVALAGDAAKLVVETRIYKGDTRTVPDFNHQLASLKMIEAEPPLPLPGPFVEQREAERREAEDD